jgi:prepilin-type N-terminal cleavage/methylation domain-containing protein
MVVRRGFTLVEVLVAVGVFTVVMIGTIAALVQFQKYSRRVSEEAIAHMYAVEILEQIESANMNDINYGGIINANLTLPANSTTNIEYPKDQTNKPVPLLTLVDSSGHTVPVQFGVTITDDTTYAPQAKLKNIQVRIVWPTKTITSAGTYQRTHTIQTSVSSFSG